MQVLPAYLAKALGELAVQPFASASLPELAAAMLPYLPHIHSASAQLLKEIHVAAQQAAQLEGVMQSSSEVHNCVAWANIISVSSISALPVTTWHVSS